MSLFINRIDALERDVKKLLRELKEERRLISAHPIPTSGDISEASFLDGKENAYQNVLQLIAELQNS